MHEEEDKQQKSEEQEKKISPPSSTDPSFPSNKGNWDRKFSLGHVSAKSSNDQKYSEEILNH